MKISTFIILCLGIFLWTGCHNRVRFPSETPSRKEVEYTTNFFAWGLVGEDYIEVVEACPQGKAYEVYARTTPIQAVLNVVTIGIYSPRTITIVCSGTVMQDQVITEPVKPPAPTQQAEPRTPVQTQPRLQPRGRPQPFDDEVPMQAPASPSMQPSGEKKKAFDMN